MWRVKGVNADEDRCERCGRTGLRKVVWLEKLDAEGNGGGEVVHFGTDCAARVMKKTATKIERMAEEADRKRAEEIRNTVYEVGAARSVVDWKIMSVSSLGDCSFIALANGSMMEVVKWAEAKWPYLHIDVQNCRSLTSGKRVAV